MAASSSSSGGRCKYDVFLSFRGEDTRKIFVGHLYRALQHKAVNAFIDSQDLDKGDRILKLLEAIEASRLSIVVLSQNYASSTWCLKELVRILECMDDKKQMVVPVFYEVDPSHVRKIEGSFAQAFAKHGDNPKIAKEELESWRSALTRVADLSGWDSRKYEDDGKLVEEIVENTFRKLMRTSSSKAKNGLVGMDFHITQMMSRLCLRENDVRVVGIWGMGGLGKTTIARAVYDKIYRQFEHYCFLDNVKEAFTSKRQKEVQEKLISILLDEKVQSLGLNTGWNMIKERLGMKKVLVVLDDVETNLQIEALLGDAHAFGEGSRVIVTTRDKQSLSAANETYKPMCLGDDEALDLFRKNAFKTNQPNGDFHHLSSRAIEYAQGLPLALTVLGAFLHNKSVCEWEAVLEKLKKIPHMGIQDVLRTSFDGLDDSEKAIFLDIACLFREWDIDLVTEILDSCGFSPVSGIRVLCDRALITVSEDNEVYMHDLLQDMGREIVRQESIEKPGNCSRLWRYQDASDALTRNTGTDAVECLILDLSNSKVDFCIHTEAFVRMKLLRLLIIYYSFYDIFYDGGDYDYDDDDDDVDEECLLIHGKIYCHGCLQFLRGDLEFLSHEMRFLLWHGCPLKSLPATFIPYNLVRLDMRSSNLRQLWEGIKPMPKLKIIMLSDCKYLVKIPDLTGAINLEKLFLDGCSSLSEVHPSVFALQNLQVLNLRWCIHLSSLEYLNLNGCSNLEKFPEISGIMKELTELRLDGTAIKGLPSSINLLLGVKRLSMRNCKNLEFLCDSTCNLPELEHLDLSGCSELKTLSTSIHLSSLKHLNLNGFSNFEKFPEISGIMKELTELRLDGTAIKGLPSSINLLLGVKRLSMRNCKNLEFLCDSTCNLPELEDLDLSGCSELKTLSTSIHLSSLKHLNLNGCSNLEKFPEILGIMKELTELCLDGTAIKGLPSTINLLVGVTRLSMTDCKSLEVLPDSICNLPALEHLDLSGFSELKTLPTSIHWSSLKYLNLNGCSNLEKFPEISGIMKELTELFLDGTAIKGLPSSIELCVGIKQLSMRNCGSLEFLPDSICNLAELTHLDLFGCSVLHNLPEKLGDLESLTHLILEACGRLKSIPELSSSVNYVDAHDCIVLETISIPKGNCTSKDFRFSNCFRLQANLFMDILDTHSLDQDNHLRLLGVYLPGSEVPKWFNLQDTGCPVTFHLPLNSINDKLLGFAVCIVITFSGAHDVSDMYGRCIWTSTGKQGEHSFKFDVLGQRFRYRFLESDHLFMRYFPWSEYRWIEDGLDAFKIVIETGTYSPTEDRFTSSCGVRLVYANHEESQNSVTKPIIHVDSQEGEVDGQTLELLPEPRTERKEEEEVMAIAAHGEVCRGLGSVCCCFSFSGCNMSLGNRNRKRRRDSI